MTSRVEELYIQTRNHPIWNYLLPLESILSYPIPTIDENIVFLNFFVYQRGWAPKGSPRPIYMPHAKLKIEYPSGRLLSYQDLTHALSEASVGEFPHEALASLSVTELMNKSSEFYEATQEIIPILQTDPSDHSYHETLKKYKKLANILFEPGLLSNYRNMNIDLFNLLDQI